ncbi:MAG TPA: diacylglycerol kinase family protein [Actinomycetota bacterium]|nr:diacylglycerol kinase family protein [Actinomycetota bacterium]
MTSPYGKATLVVGLTSAGKPFLTEDEIHRLMAGTEIEYEIQTASRPGEAASLARDAVEKGSGYLIWVGDDWTLHEVVNGIMGESGPINPDLVMAGIPGESGSDFLKTMGLNNKPADAIRHLAGEPFFGIDVGRITWAPPADPDYGYFINMAQAGLSGDMARRRQRLPRRMGRAGDLLAFWATLVRFRIPQGAVKLDRRSFGGPLANVVVANGQFVRGGIRLALKAHPGDGKLDVLIQKGNKRDFVETMTLSLKGEHLPSPKIKEYLAARVEISAKAPMPVEVDGRPLGTTPAIFEIVPQAFRLKI